MKLLAICLFLLTDVSQADELVSVRVKTGPTAEDELNAATFKVEVCSVTLETKCCTIDFLDNPKHDDFKSNALDTFAGDALKGCKGFDFERESVFVKVSINGVDAWGGYWVDLEDKEGFTVRCVQNPRQQLFYLRRSEYNLDCNILEAKSACERAGFRIECNSHQVVNVGSAVYGRMPNAADTDCSGSRSGANCKLVDVTDKVRTSCSGNICSIASVTNSYIGNDPCFGYRKYLLVEYTCN